MKKKNPWIAAILNILFMGGGYIYNGPRRIFGSILLLGCILSLIWSIKYTDVLAEASFFNDPISVIAGIVISLGFAYDAFMEAKR